MGKIVIKLDFDVFYMIYEKYIFEFEILSILRISKINFIFFIINYILLL